MRTATQVIAHLAMPRRWLAIVVLLASIITRSGILGNQAEESASRR
jgi:hypothetical protein